MAERVGFAADFPLTGVLAMATSVITVLHRGATPSISGGSRNACFRTTSALSESDGGEGVSQSPLKDQTFSVFLDQNPLFELPRKMDFRAKFQRRSKCYG
jgi:hypothetical protein